MKILLTLVSLKSNSKEQWSKYRNRIFDLEAPLQAITSTSWKKDLFLDQTENLNEKTIRVIE